MRKFFKLVTLCAFVAGVTWLLRDQLLPAPELPTSHPPAFRKPPEAPPRTSEEESATESATVGSDDLTRVNGIGPVYAKKLAELGITSFAMLAAAEADELAARGDLARDRVADWIDKAAELA